MPTNGMLLNFLRLCQSPKTFMARVLEKEELLGVKASCPLVNGTHSDAKPYSRGRVYCQKRVVEKVGI